MKSYTVYYCCVWILLLGLIFVRFTHVVLCIFKNYYIVFHCMKWAEFIYLFSCWWVFIWVAPNFFFFFNFYLFILFLAVLGLRFCTRAFSSCGKWGSLFIAVRGPLTIAASLVAEHRLQTHRLSNCGSRAQLLRGMWDPPRPGLEPMSPALAGRFSTTAPPGKPLLPIFDCKFLHSF